MCAQATVCLVARLRPACTPRLQPAIRNFAASFQDASLALFPSAPGVLVQNADKKSGVADFTAYGVPRRTASQPVSYQEISYAR